MISPDISVSLRSVFLCFDGGSSCVFLLGLVFALSIAFLLWQGRILLVCVWLGLVSLVSGARLVRACIVHVDDCHRPWSMRLQLCLHVAFPAPTVFCVLFVIEGQLAGAWFWRAIYCLIVLNRDVTLSL